MKWDGTVIKEPVSAHMRKANSKPGKSPILARSSLPQVQHNGNLETFNPGTPPHEPTC